MILAVLAASLGVSLFALYTYMIMGIHSRTHRLLPLVLGMISLIDFFQIVEYLTKAYYAFAILEKILMVQMLYLLVYYVAELLMVKFSKVTDICLFAELLAADAVVFAKTCNYNEYDFVYWAVIVCYVSIMLYQANKAYFSRDYSRREHYVNLMMYLALVVPSVCLAIRNLAPGEWKETVMPLAFSFTCGMIY